jgi:thymidine kinase
MAERITGIVGPMFCEKTLELVRQAGRLTIAGRKVQIFKPIIDDRGEGPDVVRSRFGGEWEAMAVRHPYGIIDHLEEGVDVVIVDETQFFRQKDEEGNWAIVQVLDRLTNEKGIEVIFAGLPRDFRREPFGPMDELLARSQEIHTLTAVCDHVDDGEGICGLPATETQRFVNGKPADWNDPVVLVGDVEEGYAARCLEHHVVKNKPVVVFESNKND